MPRPTIQPDPSLMSALTATARDHFRDCTTWNATVKAFIVMGLLWTPKNRASLRPSLALRIASRSAAPLARLFDLDIAANRLNQSRGHIGPRIHPLSHKSPSTLPRTISRDDGGRRPGHPAFVFSRYYGNCRYLRLLSPPTHLTIHQPSPVIFGSSDLSLRKTSVASARSHHRVCLFDQHGRIFVWPVKHHRQSTKMLAYVSPTAISQTMQQYQHTIKDHACRKIGPKMTKGLVW